MVSAPGALPQSLRPSSFEHRVRSAGPSTDSPAAVHRAPPVAADARGARFRRLVRCRPVFAARMPRGLSFPGLPIPIDDPSRMNDLLRSFGRALASALHPRMLWLTFLPFIVSAVVWGVLLWFSWQPLVDAARAALDGFALTALLYKFFNAIGASQLHAVVAPFVVVSLAIPLIVLTVLLLIATLSMPAVVSHLSKRQFASLEMKRGGSLVGSVFNSLWAAFASIALLIVTVPLWLIPPFFALLPPVIWGWLTYRVMTYDALALHASAGERRALVRKHRWPLLGIGVASGLLGTVPTFIWVSSIWMMVLFPFVAAAMIWVYAFILVFSALWFGFYCLRALQDERAAAANAISTDSTRQA